MQTTEIVIAAGVRTPQAKAGGALAREDAGRGVGVKKYFAGVFLGGREGGGAGSGWRFGVGGVCFIYPRLVGQGPSIAVLAAGKHNLGGRRG